MSVERERSDKGLSRSTPARASILINNHNYGRYLREAIESALNQTWGNVEVVVVDDGSTDSSVEVIESYAERVTAVLLDRSRGQHAAVNAGFEASTGDFVFLLDADDVFLPRKVEEVMRRFDDSPGAGACFHGRAFLTSAGVTAAPELELSGEHDLRAELASGRAPFISTTTSCMCYRRPLFAAFVPLPELEADTLGDHYLKWATLARSPIDFHPESLTLQRLHAANLYTRNRTWVDAAGKQAVCALWLRRTIPEAAAFSEVLAVQAISAALAHRRLPSAVSALRDYLRERRPRERFSLVARGLALAVAELGRAGRRRLATRRPALVPEAH